MRINHDMTDPLASLVACRVLNRRPEVPERNLHFRLATPADRGHFWWPKSPAQAFAGSTLLMEITATKPRPAISGLRVSEPTTASYRFNSTGSATLEAALAPSDSSSGSAPGATVALPSRRTANWPSNTGCARFLEISTMDVYPLNALARAMTLRSRISPVGSVADDAASAEKRNGRYFSSGCSSPSTVSNSNSPSMMVMTRSMPGKLEKSPALETSAMLTRQSHAPSWAGATFGWLANSRVTPPPLRHGSGWMSAKRMISIRPA